MDNTIWIADSRSNLQKILNTAQEFYTINDIQVNSEKSQLLIINGNTKDKLGGITIQNQHVQGTDPNIPVRILGVWHTANGTKKYQRELIQQKILKTAKLISIKRITDKQAKYIINHVLFPSLEYLLNDMVLSEETCNKLMTKITTSFKHKIGLASTVPNNMIYSQMEYGIFHLFERQIILHASNLTSRMNQTNIAAKIAEFRLQAVQNKAWTTNQVIKNFNRINHR
jgi:hypothetical protein